MDVVRDARASRLPDIDSDVESRRLFGTPQHGNRVLREGHHLGSRLRRQILDRSHVRVGYDHEVTGGVWVGIEHHEVMTTACEDIVGAIVSFFRFQAKDAAGRFLPLNEGHAPWRPQTIHERLIPFTEQASLMTTEPPTWAVGIAATRAADIPRGSAGWPNPRKTARPRDVVAHGHERPRQTDLLERPAAFAPKHPHRQLARKRRPDRERRDSPVGQRQPWGDRAPCSSRACHWLRWSRAWGRRRRHLPID